MKLYHVSYLPVDNFVLRVPKNRTKGEDDKTPRLSCADTIEGCVQAKPNSFLYIQQCLTSGLPCLMFIHEFDIPDDYPGLIGPGELEERYGVADASLTGEYCFTEMIPEYKRSVRKVIDLAVDFFGLVEKVSFARKLSRTDFFIAKYLFVYNLMHPDHPILPERAVENEEVRDVLQKLYREILDKEKTPEQNVKQGRPCP